MTEDAAKNSHTKVRTLDRGESVHARSTNPHIDFAHIVGINVGMGQSATMNSLRLMVDMNFGYSEFKYKEKNYRLALRNSRLLLELENAEIEPGSSYKAELQRGDVKQIATTNNSQVGSTDIAASTAAEAEAGWKSMLPSWSVRVHAEGKASGSRGTKNNKNLDSSVTARLELVAPAGQNAWVIGCPGTGDPRHEQGWLYGEIITASQGETPTPLCILSSIDECKPVTARLVLYAAPEHFSLTDGQNSDLKFDELCRKFKKINAHSLQRRVQIERQLKSRVAMLAAFKKISLPASENPPQGTLALISRATAFVPDVASDNK